MVDVSSIFEEVGKEHRTWFDLFEPWDIDERPDWQVEEAERYGAPIDKGPHTFQTGVFMSETFITATHAANQTGKSVVAQVQAIMFCTGVTPLALRTPKGVVTNVLREYEDPQQTEFNVMRFGRFDAETGEFLDKDVNAIQDGTWNCGYVTGAGIYPQSKMPRGDCQVWICCPKAVRDNTWIPQFKKRWPKRLLNDTSYEGGFESQQKRFHSTNGSVLSFLSYDSGYVAPEGIKAHYIVLDEEPPDPRFWGACLTHAKMISIQFTPIHGIGWTKREIIDLEERKDSDSLSISVFHCTAYDSPYLDDEVIKTQIASAPEWQIKPKFFGQFAPQTSQQPYFNRKKITKWLKSWYPRHTYMRLECAKMWSLPSDCVDAGVTGELVQENMTDEKARFAGDIWQVYEEPHVRHTYYAGIDTSSGHEDPSEGIESDWSVCVIRRVKVKGEAYDPVVAVIETLDRPIPFARQCVMGCCWYNNCLMAPEDNGASGAVFMSQVIPGRMGAYPYILKMTVIKNATRKPTEMRGWINRGPKVRREAFEALQEFVESFEWNEDPRLPNYNLILQFANCIISGKDGRPDHPRGEHDDVLVAFAITEWVRNHAPDQIRNNSKDLATAGKRRGVRDFTYGAEEKETRPVLGSRRGLDARSQGMLRRR